MSYVMVETTGATGNKELLATPASWIKWDAEGFTYLYWPNHRYLNKLKALLNDERSAPAADWEKHKCKILSKSIPSFVAADKMVQTLKRQRQAAAEASDKPQKIPVTVKKAPVPSLHDWVPKRSAKPGPNPVPVKEADEPNIQNELRRTAATPDTNMQDEVLYEFSSALNLQSAEDGEDPLGDMKPFNQLISMIYELKILIESNQQELKNKLNKGFYHIQRSVLSSIRKELIDTQPNDGQTGLRHPSMEDHQFNVKLLTCVDEFEDFESRLDEEEYRKEVHAWVDYSVGHERNPDYRIHQLLDLLFDRKFFATFSWRGGGNNKHPMCVNKNILKLFEYAATTARHKASESYVVNFFKKKLKNANIRVGNLGEKLTKPHPPGLKRKARKVHNVDGATQSESEDQLPTDAKIMKAEPYSPMRTVDSRVQRLASLKKEQSADILSAEERSKHIMIDVKHEPLSKPSQTAKTPKTSQASANTTSHNSVSGDSVVVQLNPITNMKDMDVFEARLNNTAFRKNVHNWIDNTVGHLPETDRRMAEVLDRLVDRKFLLNFSWTTEGNGKRTLMEYKNFIQLFEYVGKTVMHQTIIFNHAKVRNFFSAKLNQST